MIKNIVFDFGGVLLELDADKSFVALKKLINRNKSAGLYEDLKEHFDAFERGQLNVETFLWKFQFLADKDINPRAIIQAWNLMLLDINPKIFPFLKELRKHYKVYLLSNTNIIHIQHVLYQILEKKYNRRDWETFFDAIFYSHNMGCRKPEPLIYNTVVKETGIVPEETLFIDDNAINIQGAIDCGWHAVLHPSNAPIWDTFQHYTQRYEN